MVQNRKLKVFLCHSKDDKPKVRELYRRLVADGFDAWLDEEKLLPGQDWDLEIRKAVRESDVVVVCLSNGSLTKAGYVQKEIRFALDVADEQPEGAIYLIPARLEDCQVPSRLNKWQWVNLFHNRGSEYLKQSLESRAKYLSVVLAPPFEPKMIWIPAGKFLMGSTKEQATQAFRDGVDKDWVEQEQPQHTVELSDYSIGKYPITNREYQFFVQDTRYNPPSGWIGDRFPAENGNHPVVNISWYDAVNYSKWLSDKTKKQYRLPTEAEWEKAARGEDGLIYPWGSKFDPKSSNTLEAQIGDTSEVGQFSPYGDSPYGCADMAGNVWEWCADWFDAEEYKNKDRIKDPQGPLVGTYRVLRGGSFASSPGSVRCAHRNRLHRSNFDLRYGFRVVSSPIKLESVD
jgi:toxoflavin biosynthesis protein ToxD